MLAAAVDLRDAGQPGDRDRRRAASARAVSELAELVGAGRRHRPGRRGRGCARGRKHDDCREQCADPQDGTPSHATRIRPGPGDCPPSRARPPDWGAEGWGSSSPPPGRTRHGRSRTQRSRTEPFPYSRHSASVKSLRGSSAWSNTPAPAPRTVGATVRITSSTRSAARACPAMLPPPAIQARACPAAATVSRISARSPSTRVTGVPLGSAAAARAASSSSWETSQIGRPRCGRSWPCPWSHRSVPLPDHDGVDTGDEVVEVALLAVAGDGLEERHVVAGPGDPPVDRHRRVPDDLHAYDVRACSIAARRLSAG